MNEYRQLVTTDGDGLDGRSWKTCSKGLLSLLTEGDDAGRAVYALTKSEALRDEARSLIPHLAAAKAPISEIEFAKIMGRQRVLFGLGDREPAEWATMLRGYFEVLKDFSAPMLEDAFHRWNRGEGHKDPAMAQFFPKPAQLVMLAQKSKADVFVAHYRATKAIARAQEAPIKTEGEKKGAREKAIELGFLNPDGSFNMTPKRMPEPERPRLSPQQVAAQLRARAEEEPPEDDPGPII